MCACAVVLGLGDDGSIVKWTGAMPTFQDGLTAFATRVAEQTHTDLYNCSVQELGELVDATN
eukprot:COSAG06_NODE_8722_length_2087_cov_3.590543_3_plen_62_part_00